MWLIDSVEQEVVWTDEALYATDLAYDDREDEVNWSDEQDDDAFYQAEWDQMAEDCMMEFYLFGDC